MFPVVVSVTMPDEIADLAAKRQNSTAERLLHPAGVSLPFDGPSDAALIIPEIRSELRSGAYSADLVRLLPEPPGRRRQPRPRLRARRECDGSALA